MATEVEIVCGDDARTKVFPVETLNDPVQTYESNPYVNLTDSGVVKAEPGTLCRLAVNNPGTSITVTLYDNTAASGTKIATVLLAAGMSLAFNATAGTGIYASFSATTGSPDITITYR